MPAQVTNYKCPACTGPLTFDGASGKLACEYCGSTYGVAEIEAMYAEKEAKAEAAHAQAQEKAREEREAAAESGWDTSAVESAWGAEAETMRAYSCPSCGAELICDETTAATSCPYCDNPTVVPGQFSGAMRPDLVIPFRLDKNAAMEALKNHYKGKVFLPKGFADKNRIQEIKGVYVPFWLFDGVAEADVEYRATRSHSHTEGNERVTVTEHYAVRRAGCVAFEKIPADASGKMPDAHMDAIEPFDYSDLKPFSTAYLPGYLADKYDVEAEESARRVEERAVNTAYDALAASVFGYESVIPLRQDAQVHRGKVHYALMPVWMLNTKWQGKGFLFAMNGQTGKLIGDLPISWGKFWAWFAGIAVPLAAILAVILL